MSKQQNLVAKFCLLTNFRLKRRNENTLEHVQTKFAASSSKNAGMFTTFDRVVIFKQMFGGAGGG